MNNKGQTMGLAILGMLAVFICGFIFINFLMPEVTTFRTAMSCASVDTISDGQKILCLFGDLTIPYFILGLLSLGVGAITARLNL